MVFRYMGIRKTIPYTLYLYYHVVFDNLGVVGV